MSALAGWGRRSPGRLRSAPGTAGRRRSQAGDAGGHRWAHGLAAAIASVADVWKEERVLIY